MKRAGNRAFRPAEFRYPASETAGLARYVESVTRSLIVSAVRTPFGKLNGGLAAYPATELGAIAIRAGLERVGLEGSEVDYVIMGQVLQAGARPAPPRPAPVPPRVPRPG